MRLLSVMLGLVSLWGTSVSHGQTTSITSSGLNTQVTFNSGAPVPTYDITGGTRPGNGTNLFHSFGEFSVGTHDIARFGNDSGLPTTNILSRVTGGNPSNIFGNISTTTFRGANLYLINPAGILFGPAASLNVGGSVTFSTADYLRLADGLRFNAIPGPQDGLLSQAPVVAFGFLNPHPKPITVQGATLEVPEGKALSLVGGDITLADGTLRAPGGQIDVVSVASRGEVHVSPALGEAAQPDVRGFQTLGKITMTDATVETSPVTARSGVGPIVVRGGQLVMANSTITGVSRTGENLGGPITINVSDTINTVGSRIESGTNEGVGGAVSLTAGQAIRLTNSTVESSGVSVFGRPGSVELTAPVVRISGNSNGISVVSASGANGSFRGNLANEGSVAVHADRFILEDGSQINATGAILGGTVVINAADTVRIDQGRVNVSALPGSFTGEGVQAGNISIAAGEAVRFNHAELFAGTESGNAGNIVIEAGKTFVSESGAISAGSRNGNGGNIVIQAGERIRMDGGLVTTRAGGEGTGGNITLSADVVRLRDATVQSTAVNGPGGTITIDANDFRTVNSTIDVNSQFGQDGTVILP
jgi:filamentous hemagglutinin family protein